MSTIFSRDSRLAATREEITRRLGAAETKRLMAEGADASVDDALAQIADWLRAG